MYFRKPLEPGLKLAVTLRHMATGSTFRQLMFSFRVAENTISVFVPQVLESLIATLKNEVMPPVLEPEQWYAISDKFNTRWNFPHICGAIDGKHIPIKAPPKSGSLYYNYKGFFSMILLALADAEYKFIWASIAEYGSASDCQVFNESDLRKLLEEGELGFPTPEPLPGMSKNIPYFFVGDDAFPLRTWMMKPYSRMGLGHDERIFNYRISRARRVVENSFGILANRFRCLLAPCIYRKTKNVQSLVLACVMLHNLLRIRSPDDTVADQEDASHNLVPGAWRDEATLTDAGVRTGGNIDHNEGKSQRDYLKKYFVSDSGQVPWQEQMIA